jgi:predicted AAA+ superfamily ATPase
LIEVFSSVAQQTGNKFNYSYPNTSLDNRQIKEALDLLQMAGLIYRVTHSSSNGIPLGAEINSKKTKYLIFDTGIFQRIMGLNMSDLLLSDDFDSINKGNIAELHVGLELIKSESPYQNHPLFYWQREEKNSQAEVDFVEQFGDAIIPIEVKSGKKGSMQSLYIFLKEKNLPFGIRISIENFAEMDHVKILPIFAVHRLKKTSLIQ